MTGCQPVTPAICPARRAESEKHWQRYLIPDTAYPATKSVIFSNSFLEAFFLICFIDKRCLMGCPVTNPKKWGKVVARGRPLKLGQQLRGGGKTYRVNWGGGRGENVLQSVLSKTTFGGLRNWGWSGRCLFLLREMTESRQKRGGETYRKWGVQKRFWGGVFRRIYGMFSTPLCFPPRLAAL